MSAAEEPTPYPHELEGYRFYQTARWRELKPLVSTLADVRRIMGEPKEQTDIGHQLWDWAVSRR